MATTQEPTGEGLAELGRQVADDAARLVRAEVALAKAQLKESVLRFALGGGLVVAALLLGLFFFIFTIGTLVEGVDPLDSWPLYVSVGSLLIGAVMLAVSWPRWISWLGTTIGVVGMIAFVAGLVWFYVAAIIGGNGEIARRGWAIAAVSFFGGMVLLGGVGALLIKRGIGEAKGTVSDIKEDAAWVTQLTKRAKSGS